MDLKIETAIFAAGCFWGVEEAFRHLEGVKETRVGYSGGNFANPTYKDVCSDKTGHAEAVEVTYDPGIISYEKLLDVFWSIHDPTEFHRQGPDVGSQYRSAIFYAGDAQKSAAEKSMERLAGSGKYTRPIATEIMPTGTFWPAEDYHQQYFEKTGRATCRVAHPSK